MARLYTLSKLAQEGGTSAKTLRTWRQRGWLKPTAMVGGDERYTMAAFEAACAASLPEAQRPASDAKPQRGWTKRIVKEIEEEKKRAEMRSRRQPSRNQGRGRP